MDERRDTYVKAHNQGPVSLEGKKRRDGVHAGTPAHEGLQLEVKMRHARNGLAGALKAARKRCFLFKFLTLRRDLEEWG